MKSKLLATLSIFTILVFNACHNEFLCEKADGYVETREYHLSDFKGISMGLNGNVVITKGTEQKVVVEAQSEVLDNLSTHVSSENWNISLDKCFRNYTKVNVYITTPTLNKVSLSSSGSIIGQSTFTTNDFMVSLSGSGIIDLTVEANTIDTNLSGSGNISLSGTSNEHDISIAGSGNVNSYSLATNSTLVRVSGSGNSYVMVNELLDVSISGSGNVYYDGNPEIKLSKSGSGQVVKKE